MQFIASFRSKKIAEDMLKVAAKGYCGSGGRKAFEITKHSSESSFQLYWSVPTDAKCWVPTPEDLRGFIKGYMKAKGIRD